MSTKTKKRILIYALILLALYLLIYVIPSVSGLLKGTYSAKYGQLRIEDETTGYMVRDEVVYVSTAGGSVNRFVKEGDLVRSGTTVMEITGSSDGEPSNALTEIVSALDEHKASTSDFVATKGGTVSFCVDGHEEDLNFESLKSLKYSMLETIKDGDVIHLNDSKIKGGEPAFKIVDKSRWYMVAFVDQKEKDRYVEGSNITVEFKELGKKDNPLDIEMSVYQVKKQEDKLKVVLESNRYFDEYCCIRAAQVNLVTSDVNGIIIDNDSITEKKGQKGVYVKNKKDKDVFVPIKIIATDGKDSAIADSYYFDAEGERIDTVSPYDDVLKNPSRAKEEKKEKSKK